LGGLLSELGCESHYLFLLLRDRCLQLLNLVIEHGLMGLGTHARLRYATIKFSRVRPGARKVVKAKMVVIKVQSNYNNVVAVNGLLVVEDTTDVALLGVPA